MHGCTGFVDCSRNFVLRALHHVLAINGVELLGMVEFNRSIDQRCRRRESRVLKQLRAWCCSLARERDHI
jgi:hypothetical protein